MRRNLLYVLILFMTAMFGSAGGVRAQDSVFPLPAPLYILISENQVMRINPQTGEQTIISPPEQRIADFDIAPDGQWYAYRMWENNAVIVSEMATGNGYVLEFAESAPPPSSPAQTIAWSPDATILAYIVAEGVRIADLTADEYTGEIKTLKGPWVELYWDEAYWLDKTNLTWAHSAALIANDAAGSPSLIQTSTYPSAQAVTDADPREQPPVSTALTAEGVMLDNQMLIPNTAGALAFDWGPPAPPVVAGLVMKADLYFLSADAQNIAQVWQLPRTGEAARPVTTANADITAYAVAPDQRQIAYITADTLIVADLSGANARQVATLQAGGVGHSVDWSPDSAQLAFHDGRGIWLVPADGSLPQRRLIEHEIPANQADMVKIRTYFAPRWSPDGTRLLVSIGQWEWVSFGILDAATGSLTELDTLSGSESAWTTDGQIIAWSWYYYMGLSPGVFLVDPDIPFHISANLVSTQMAVWDVADQPDGYWYAVTSMVSRDGPQYLSLVGGPSFAEPYFFSGANRAGGFVEMPRLSAPERGGVALVAGLRNQVQDLNRGQAPGDLIILNMGSGESVQIQTNSPVWNIRWVQ